MQAAIGLAQLDRLESFVATRRRNHAFLREAKRVIAELEAELAARGGEFAGYYLSTRRAYSGLEGFVEALGLRGARWDTGGCHFPTEDPLGAAPAGSAAIATPCAIVFAVPPVSWIENVRRSGPSSRCSAPGWMFTVVEVGAVKPVAGTFWTVNTWGPAGSQVL